MEGSAVQQQEWYLVAGMRDLRGVHITAPIQGAGHERAVQICVQGFLPRHPPGVFEGFAVDPEGVTPGAARSETLLWAVARDAGHPGEDAPTPRGGQELPGLALDDRCHPWGIELAKHNQAAKEPEFATTAASKEQLQVQDWATQGGRPSTLQVRLPIQTRASFHRLHEEYRHSEAWDSRW